MTVKDLVPPVIVLTLFGFLVVHAGDDDGLRGLTVEEQMRDPNFWQNWYDPKPVRDKKERDKMLEPIKDRAISDDEIDRMDVARHLLPPPGDAVAERGVAFGTQNTRDQQPRTQEVATMNDENERSGASDGSVQPLAWGVMPGDNLPLWRCSSRRQAEEVVVWLRKQRPASTPQAVPLVDGRHPPTAEVARLRDVISRAASYWIHLNPGVAWEGDIADAMAAAVAEIARLRLTDAEREAIGRASDTLRYLQADYGKTQTEQDAATLRGLLERMGGGG
jgi:hypothetical protein